MIGGLLIFFLAPWNGQAQDYCHCRRGIHLAAFLASDASTYVYDRFEHHPRRKSYSCCILLPVRTNSMYNRAVMHLLILLILLALLALILLALLILLIPSLPILPLRCSLSPLIRKAGRASSTISLPLENPRQAAPGTTCLESIFSYGCAPASTTKLPPRRALKDTMSNNTHVSEVNIQTSLTLPPPPPPPLSSASSSIRQALKFPGGRSRTFEFCADPGCV
jgi:hypothetical protein